MPPLCWIFVARIERKSVSCIKGIEEPSQRFVIRYIFYYYKYYYQRSGSWRWWKFSTEKNSKFWWNKERKNECKYLEAKHVWRKYSSIKCEERIVYASSMPGWKCLKSDFDQTNPEYIRNVNSGVLFNKLSFICGTLSRSNFIWNRQPSPPSLCFG